MAHSDGSEGGFFDRERLDPLSESVVRVLREAHDKGLECDRLFAKALDTRLWKLWGDARGWKLSRGHLCVQRLLGKKCGQTLRSKGYQCEDHWPPAADHVSVWNRGGKVHAFVYQPYGMGWRSLCELVEWCTARGLRADVGETLSWHFPGWTVMVEIRREEDR